MPPPFELSRDGAPSGDALRGVYIARRAAALSGVPERTLTYWAQQGWYLPSISPEPRTRLWSWYDLLALRTIDWLRQPGADDEGVPILKVRFPRIRGALEMLEQKGHPRAALHDLVLRTQHGELYFEVGDTVIRADVSGQIPMRDVVRLVRPYKVAPDLLEPRPLLRIVPGKLHGEPHVTGTRISSSTLYVLHTEGYLLPQIAEMYPDATLGAISQAIDLEQSLSKVA